MLLPKKTKYRRVHRGRRGRASHARRPTCSSATTGSSSRSGWITNRQIEAARIAMTRKIKRGGKVWINVFPDKSVTQKPAETRMAPARARPSTGSPSW